MRRNVSIAACFDYRMLLEEQLRLAWQRGTHIYDKIFTYRDRRN